MSGQTDKTLIRQSVWLGVGVGWLTQLGLNTFLPLLVLVGIRMFSLETDDKSLWLENPGNSSHPVWYALQASIFVGSAIAGAIAALLSPRGSWKVPVLLVILSLTATGFEQFPRPLTPMVIAVWSGGPCIGLLFGFFAVRWMSRGKAYSN